MSLKFYAKLVCLASLVSGCSTIKAYEKEYLVSPVMSDIKKPVISYEKISSSGATSSTNCPTCGG